MNRRQGAARDPARFLHIEHSRFARPAVDRDAAFAHGPLLYAAPCGIGRNAFRRLLSEHEADGELFDRDTFPGALIAACSLDPVLTVAEVTELGDLLTDGQWDELFSASWDACREVDDVPFSALASAVTRD